jgi:hypothetical protein
MKNIIISKLKLWSQRLKERRLNHDFEKAYENIKQDPIMGLDLDTIRNKYGYKFSELREIVNNNDPTGLISMGAPIDEYEPEVKTIIVQLDNTNDENEVLDLVFSEFEKWFGDAGRKENYLKLANDIYNWKKMNK